ncbi:MAG: sporulation protein YqfD [Desulfotomaculaceae bacterium]|nr:sporulation protein YqfD [Desulfotomaculaceae bacterium]MDD4766529.1 sporulation protein YqfD [Desulfotomaculaceae bacterium]
MLLFRIMSCLQGYLVIHVTGDAPERFVNMATSRGIYLWDVEQLRNGTVIIKVYLKDVKALRHIARRTRCRFRIRQRFGLPFYVAMLRRRRALALGAFLFLIILCSSTSFIWFIEVKGNEKLDSSYVLQVAEQAGLRRGTLKWNINPGAVEHKIVAQLPQLSWSGVYIKGTKVTIEVAERIVPEEEDRQPAHIVAKKTGVIKEVLVLNGRQAVKEGDTVSPGQVLISGEILPVEEPSQGEAENKPTEEAKPVRYVHAMGITRARVWYEGYSEVSLVETGKRPTGRQKNRVSIKFKSKEIILSGNQNEPFETYETRTFVNKAPEWRNIALPVELITVKYFELADYKEERSRSAARRTAEEQAYAMAAESMPDDAGIQERWVEEVETGDSDKLVRIKVIIETVEDIGEEALFNGVPGT